MPVQGDGPTYHRMQQWRSEGSHSQRLYWIKGSWTGDISYIFVHSHGGPTSSLLFTALNPHHSPPRKRTEKNKNNNHEIWSYWPLVPSKEDSCLQTQTTSRIIKNSSRELYSNKVMASPFSHHHSKNTGSCRKHHHSLGGLLERQPIHWLWTMTSHAVDAW